MIEAYVVLTGLACGGWAVLASREGRSASARHVKEQLRRAA
jgi:hypothetical protein